MAYNYSQETSRYVDYTRQSDNRYQRPSSASSYEYSPKDYAYSPRNNEYLPRNEDYSPRNEEYLQRNPYSERTAEYSREIDENFSKNAQYLPRDEYSSRSNENYARNDQYSSTNNEYSSRKKENYTLNNPYASRNPEYSQENDRNDEYSRGYDSSGSDRKLYGDKFRKQQGYSNQALQYDNGEYGERPETEVAVQTDIEAGPSWEPIADRAASRTASEIYASRYPKSEYSHYTNVPGVPHPADVVKVKTKTSHGGKLVMETMTAPHPCCPNTKSVCCLLILLNLSLLLLCLGFIVVLQLSEPPYIWYFGIVMLVVGFLVLFGSLIYCIIVCRETEHLRAPPGELYWTNHWTKTARLPEIQYSNTQNKPADYKGSEFSFKTAQSRTTTAGTSHTKY